MSRKMRIFIGVLVTFSMLVSGVGYASLTDTLSVTGTASAERTGIFITDIRLKGYTEAYEDAVFTDDKVFTLNNVLLSTESGPTTEYLNEFRDSETKTTVDSNYKSTIKTYDNDNKTLTTTVVKPVVFTITVANNTNEPIRYYFHKVAKTDTNYTNTDITYAESVSEYAPSDTNFSAPSFTDGEQMKIDVVFYIREDNIKPFDELSLLLGSATLSLVFDVNEAEVEDAVVSNVTQSLEDLLNDEQHYETLTDAITGNFDDDPERFWTGTYIGNVDGSEDEDSEIIKALFGEDIKQIIGDTEQSVTLIIKWENIDGDENTGTDYTLTTSDGTSSKTYKGCEMTLYMTTEDLIDGWAYGQYAERIYATVYTCTKTVTDGKTTYGEWYQLGNTYAGKAQVVGYAGGEINGSFNTGEWSSVESYHDLGTGAKLADIIDAFKKSLS